MWVSDSIRFYEELKLKIRLGHVILWELTGQLLLEVMVHLENVTLHPACLG